MNQCARCGGWFGLTSWMCDACQQLTHHLYGGGH
jgi:hypothetical protein